MWEKMFGGIESSSSTFYPENVYQENGNLVIKMERDYEEEAYYNEMLANDEEAYGWWYDGVPFGFGEM